MAREETWKENTKCSVEKGKKRKKIKKTMDVKPASIEPSLPANNLLLLGFSSQVA